MSRLCIFGADGRTGIQVVKTALADGHDVVAFVYDKENMNHFDESVQVIHGNILDALAVEEAINGVDIVISVVGHIKNSDPLMQTKGIKNIISAMKKNNIKRLVSLTGTGARIPGDTPSLADRFLNMIVNKIDPERINDGKEHLVAIQESHLDWTILRVLKLTNSDFNGKYNLTEHGPVELTTSRRRVARIMIDLAISEDYIGKMPISS
ncbi:MAG: putative NADH-flavin reductase [Flavobacteriaceae bacterium]|jgi:putative NADH-flavin reductase